MSESTLRQKITALPWSPMRCHGGIAEGLDRKDVLAAIDAHEAERQEIQDRAISTKVEVFASLAKAATPGEWRCRDGETIVMPSRSAFIRVDPHGYISAKDHVEAVTWSGEDRRFILFCANNRDIITRALRTKELVDTPSCAFLDDLRNSIGCETHSEPRAVLAVFQEATS